MTTNAIHTTPGAHSHYMDSLYSPTSSSSSELRRGSLSSNMTDDDNMTPHQMYSRFLYDHTRLQMERFANQTRQNGQSRDLSPTSTTSSSSDSSEDYNKSDNKKSKWKKIFSL